MSDHKTLSQDAIDYFDQAGDWHAHFSEEIIAEAREYYREALAPGEYGRGHARECAWVYAQGASRFMQVPVQAIAAASSREERAGDTAESAVAVISDAPITDQEALSLLKKGNPTLVPAPKADRERSVGLSEDQIRIVHCEYGDVEVVNDRVRFTGINPSVSMTDIHKIAGFSKLCGEQVARICDYFEGGVPADLDLKDFAHYLTNLSL